jgi:hypothetical protein
VTIVLGVVSLLPSNENLFGRNQQVINLEMNNKSWRTCTNFPPQALPLLKWWQMLLYQCCSTQKCHLNGNAKIQIYLECRLDGQQRSYFSLLGKLNPQKINTTYYKLWEKGKFEKIVLKSTIFGQKQIKKWLLKVEKLRTLGRAGGRISIAYRELLLARPAYTTTFFSLKG